TDPWWELDLGTERALEAVTLWNRTDGALGRRLDGVVVTLLDAARRVVFEHALAEAPAVSRRIDLEGPAARLQRGAARGLGALASRGIASGEVVTALCARFDDAALRGAVIGALRDVPAARWPPGAAEALAE